MLPLLFYNTDVQMSANVINNTGGQSVQAICPIWAHTWMHRQLADSDIWWCDKSLNYKLQYEVKQMSEQ